MIDEIFRKLGIGALNYLQEQQISKRWRNGGEDLKKTTDKIVLVQFSYILCNDEVVY